MSITAIIPTRKGSERVKNKNTKPFVDTTLLDNKIKMVIRLLDEGLIDDIVVNSNCDESFKIAKKYGVRYVEREEYYASSKCDIRDYWINVTENIKTDNFMLCQVTNPFIKYDTYKECINKFSNTNSILTVTRLKDYIWRGDKPINYILPNHPKSQDLPDDIFKLNFGICIISVKDIKKYKNLVIPNTEFIYLTEIESTDIDTEFDFMIAEKIYEMGENYYENI